jgi:hypothetical protein
MKGGIAASVTKNNKNERVIFFWLNFHLCVFLSYTVPYFVALQAALQKVGVKGKALFEPLRLALTGPRLLIAADGTNSTVKKLLSIPNVSQDYKETAWKQ